MAFHPVSFSYSIWFCISNFNALLIFYLGHRTISPAHIYGLVKYYCDQKFGVVSQCFMTEKALQLPGGYFDNFLLKVNGKMNGLNAVVDPSMVQSLPFNMERTMFVGIDVNHPAETERLASSVAVAVGSMDKQFSSYTPCIRVQKKERDEIIKNLDEMIAELLQEYFRVNKTHPQNLVIFRDGVSEGQFEKVNKAEIPLIVAGIKKAGKPMKITVIVTQKHHNTRFALTKANNSGRKPTWNDVPVERTQRHGCR